MNKLGKIFLACALGAFIGALIALQLGVYLWWIGMIVGGFVGYLSYEFKKVLEAGTCVWRTTCVLDWKKIGCAARKRIWAISLIASFWMFWTIIFLCLIFSLLFLCRMLKTPLVLFEIAPLILVLSAFFTLILFPALSPIIWGKSDDAIKEGFLMWKTYHPFKVFFYWIPLKMCKTGCFIVLRILKAIPIALTIIGLFIKRLFILIHSDERLLCGVDAAIGAAIGYFLGSAFLGAIVGGCLGVLNYELISKRLLGLTHG